jgi:hypothetical protein
MTPDPGRQWSIATGYGAVLCGIGAVMLERPWPTDPTALPDFLVQNRTMVLWQGLLFVLGAGFAMWFLGSLRTVLIRVEPVGGRVTMIAFAAGMVGYGLTVLALAPQMALTLPGRAWIEPAMAAMAVDVGYVMLTLTNVPMAVMYAAVAVVSLRERAFPAWLGWVAALAAACCTALVFSLIDPTGPLAPQGWLSYVLYLVPVLWLTAAPTLMLLDARRRPAETRIRFTVTT